MTPKKKTGPKPSPDANTVLFATKVDIAAAKKIRSAAKRAKLSISEWIRRKLTDGL